jgi:hypothetical protein
LFDKDAEIAAVRAAMPIPAEQRGVMLTHIHATQALALPSPSSSGGGVVYVGTTSQGKDVEEPRKYGEIKKELFTKNELHAAVIAGAKSAVQITQSGATKVEDTYASPLAGLRKERNISFGALLTHHMLEESAHQARSAVKLEVSEEETARHNAVASSGGTPMPYFDRCLEHQQDVAVQLAFASASPAATGASVSVPTSIEQRKLMDSLGATRKTLCVRECARAHELTRARVCVRACAGVSPDKQAGLSRSQASCVISMLTKQLKKNPVYTPMTTFTLTPPERKE